MNPTTASRVALLLTVLLCSSTFAEPDPPVEAEVYTLGAQVSAQVSAIQAHIPKPEDEVYSLSSEVSMKPVFQNKTSYETLSILLLFLGESTVWRAIWSRLRFRLWHPKQWVFAVAPGWGTLAGSLFFAAVQASRGTSNLVHDRPPLGALDAGLLMTNLQSGETHAAKNVLLQNIWHSWKRGPRVDYFKALATIDQHKPATQKAKRRKEVGIVDVDVAELYPRIVFPSRYQTLCLVAQLLISLILGLFGLSLEVFILFLVTLLAQVLLLWAVTPGQDAWDHRPFTEHSGAPMLFHMGMQSEAVLFVRVARCRGDVISLDEFSRESEHLRDTQDVGLLIAAGCSLLLFILQLFLVGWMNPGSRLLFLYLASAGLLANAIEAATEPDWTGAYRYACEGEPICEPEGSSLMGAVGVLLAGAFPAAMATSKLLYPDDDRNAQTRQALSERFDSLMCENCRGHLTNDSVGACKTDTPGELCSTKLATEVDNIVGQTTDKKLSPEEKQTADGLATVCTYLRRGTAEHGPRKPDTTAKLERWDWNRMPTR